MKITKKQKEKIIDEHRIEQIQAELTFKKIQGSGNKCPKCKAIGYFGTINRYCNEKEETIICGWCGKITKVKGK